MAVVLGASLTVGLPVAAASVQDVEITARPGDGMLVRERLGPDS